MRKFVIFPGKAVAVAVVAVIACVASSGCKIFDCGSLNTVTFSTDPTLLIGTSSRSSEVRLAGTLDAGKTTPDNTAIYQAVESSKATGSGIEVTMIGQRGDTGEQVSLTLILPTPFKVQTLRVDSAVQRALDLPANQRQNWGVGPAPAAGNAFAAFRTAYYTFPPPGFTDTYVATSSSGTVSFTRKIDKGYQMSLDLTFHDAAGTVMTVRGNAQLFVTVTPATCID